MAGVAVARLDSPDAGRRLDRWLIGAVALSMAATGALSVAMASTMASGHAQFHLLFGLFGLVPAVLVAARARPSGATWVAIAGFLALALSQLLEAVGAWGFGPDNATEVSRTFHDVHNLGVALGPVGLLGGVMGVCAVTFAALRGRANPVVILIVLLGVGAVALFVIAKLIGL